MGQVDIFLKYPVEGVLEIKIILMIIETNHSDLINLVFLGLNYWSILLLIQKPETQ